MLTPHGPRAIETFQVGDEILTRLEWEPDAPVVVSQVEARFENVARIWHLHLASGQVIRTTAEHPFYVDGRGWLPAGELRPGDLLVSHDGQRVAVAELYDTGTYERVYNLAIRSFHTYFVCDETWPFSVWAHNACSATSGNNRFAQYGKAKHDELSEALRARNFKGATVLPNGMRVDGIKTFSDASGEIVQAIVYELKPKNPRAIARGLKQLEEYIPEVRRMLGIDNVRGVILKYQGLPH